MKNLRYEVAVVYYQDNTPVIIKIGDYVEIEFITGRIINGKICEIDTETMVIHLVYGSDNWFDMDSVKRIIQVNEVVE